METRSQILSQILSPAFWLWVRSHLDAAIALQVQIHGSDRQLLGGYIPQVLLQADSAVYQGLHFGRLELRARQIRINLAQVLKGHPLRLLEPVSLRGQLELTQTHLVASLTSVLLAEALSDLLSALLTTDLHRHGQMHWQHGSIKTDQLLLTGDFTTFAGDTAPVVVRTGLHLASPQHLCLWPLSIESSSRLFLNYRERFELDLGSQVNLENLSLTPGQLLLRGSIQVSPEIKS